MLPDQFHQTEYIPAHFGFGLLIILRVGGVHGASGHVYSNGAGHQGSGQPGAAELGHFHALLTQLQQRLTDEGGLVVEPMIALVDNVHALGFGIHTAQGKAGGAGLHGLHLGQKLCAGHGAKVRIAGGINKIPSLYCKQTALIGKDHIFNGSSFHLAIYQHRIHDAMNTVFIHQLLGRKLIDLRIERNIAAGLLHKAAAVFDQLLGKAPGNAANHLAAVIRKLAHGIHIAGSGHAAQKTEPLNEGSFGALFRSSQRGADTGSAATADNHIIAITNGNHLGISNRVHFSLLYAIL